MGNFDDLTFWAFLIVTLFIGTVCWLIMWWHTVFRWFKGTPPSWAFGLFTAALLSEVAAYFQFDRVIRPRFFAGWERVSASEWTVFWSCLCANFALLIGSVILSKQGPKIVKYSSRAFLLAESALAILFFSHLHE